MRGYRLRLLSLLVYICLSAGTTEAGELTAAVASNFHAPMEKIIDAFNRKTGHTVKASYGSSGKFTTQIKTGAPFDIFLSADEVNPLKLEEDGYALLNSHFVYAIGTLVLWSRTSGFVDDKGKVLGTESFRKLAIANPQHAPYGIAARETLEKMSLWNSVQKKIVIGENITQAYQFIFSKNADLGFVALSQIVLDGKIMADGSFWIVPHQYYKPIRQVAVILKNARDKKLAKEFFEFLKGNTSRDIMKNYGYTFPAENEAR